jgi:hypothetical protein
MTIQGISRQFSAGNCKGDTGCRAIGTRYQPPLRMLA